MVVRVGPREGRPSIAMVPPLALRRIRAFGSTLTLRSRRRMLVPRCERSPIRSLDALSVRPNSGATKRETRPALTRRGLFFVTGTAAFRLGLNTYGRYLPAACSVFGGPSHGRYPFVGRSGVSGHRCSAGRHDSISSLTARDTSPSRMTPAVSGALWRALALREPYPY